MICHSITPCHGGNDKWPSLKVRETSRKTFNFNEPASYQWYLQISTHFKRCPEGHEKSARFEADYKRSKTVNFSFATNGSYGKVHSVKIHIRMILRTFELKILQIWWI